MTMLIWTGCFRQRTPCRTADSDTPAPATAGKTVERGRCRHPCRQFCGLWCSLQPLADQLQTLSSSSPSPVVPAGTAVTLARYFAGGTGDHRRIYHPGAGPGTGFGFLTCFAAVTSLTLPCATAASNSGRSRCKFNANCTICSETPSCWANRARTCIRADTCICAVFLWPRPPSATCPRSNLLRLAAYARRDHAALR